MKKIALGTAVIFTWAPALAQQQLRQPTTFEVQQSQIFGAMSMQLKIVSDQLDSVRQQLEAERQKNADLQRQLDEEKVKAAKAKKD